MTTEQTMLTTPAQLSIQIHENKNSQIRENKYTNTLDEFLNEWDVVYRDRIKSIALFNPTLTLTWSNGQKAYFAKVFYHSRGYFRDFLWYLGNFAPNKTIKMIILENIAEEFNNDNPSHEQHYLDFAKTMGADLSDEILNQTNYTSEMREFNKKHIFWLHQNNWESGFAAFSAYERLDAIDYKLLLPVTSPEHSFFKIHREAEHFSKTYQELKNIWIQNKVKVLDAFNFISETQAEMWQNLSDSVFSYMEVTREDVQHT